MEFKDLFAASGLNVGGKEVFILALLAIWEIIWKGFGLWRAAKNNHTGWFIAMLLLNTFGILPIIYINFFAPEDSSGTK
jgi:hypothetical protein